MKENLGSLQNISGRVYGLQELVKPLQEVSKAVPAKEVLETIQILSKSVEPLSQISKIVEPISIAAKSMEPLSQIVKDVEPPDSNTKDSGTNNKIGDTMP